MMLKIYFVMLNLRNYSVVFLADRIYLSTGFREYTEKSAIFCCLKKIGRILQQKGGGNEYQWILQTL